MVFVAIPQIFENMEEATIGKWLVSQGQSVSEGTPLCELVTEKTTLELPSPASGIVRHLAAPEKATLHANFIIALVGEENEALPDLESLNPKIEIAPQISAPAPIATPAEANAGSRLRATPAARRAAKVAGVELEQVAQMFPGKVLSEEDVKAFAAKS